MLVYVQLQSMAIEVYKVYIHVPSGHENMSPGTYLPKVLGNQLSRSRFPAHVHLIRGPGNRQTDQTEYRHTTLI